MTQTSPTMGIANVFERLTALEARSCLSGSGERPLTGGDFHPRKQERNIFAALRALFAGHPVSLIAGTQVVTNCM